MDRPGDKMRAAVIPNIQSKWKVDDVPVPKPAANQVLIKIHASGLCYSDVHITNGDLPFSLPFPLTAGHEPVGEIVELGDGVSIRKKEIELVYHFYKVLVADVNGAYAVSPYTVISSKVQVFNCKAVMPNIC